MFFLRSLINSMRSLHANLLRSILAMLGIIIGVAAVISAMGTIEGATVQVMRDMQSAGSTVMWITPGGKIVHGRHVGQVSELKLEDVDEVATNPYVQAAAPEVRAGAQIKFGATNRASLVVGTSPEFFEVFSYQAASGTTFRRDAVIGSSRVCVLGSKLADELFGEKPPVGENIRIGSLEFDVIGVMDKKGMVGFMNYDEQVYIPVSRAIRMFNPQSLTSIGVRSIATSDMDEAKESIAGTLRRRHALQIGEEDDFNITTLSELFNTFRKNVRVMESVLFAICGISLLVGGFGIMNIMLVSVTERTREIGVRMAVGAYRSDILVQFLAESSMICIVGSPLGILAAWMGNEVIKAKLAPLVPVVALNVVLLAVGVSIATGILSGLYPAWRASRLDPVEALRYE